MRIIGLAGRSGVGKSTLSSTYLRPFGFAEAALADEIKIRAVATGVATYEQVFTLGPKLPHVRTWLQEEGTERGRNVFGQDVWVRALLARLRRMSETGGPREFVVTDVRFANEVRGIRQAGGIVLLVDAPSRNAGNGMTADQRLHASETGLDGLSLEEFDGVVLNDPEHANTIGWQLHAHLYYNNFVTEPYAGTAPDDAARKALVKVMLPYLQRA